MNVHCFKTIVKSVIQESKGYKVSVSYNLIMRIQAIYGDNKWLVQRVNLIPLIKDHSRSRS